MPRRWKTTQRKNDQTSSPFAPGSAKRRRYNRPVAPPCRRPFGHTFHAPSRAERNATGAGFCLTSAPSRSLIDATGALLSFNVCAPGRRNADATLPSPPAGKVPSRHNFTGIAQRKNATADEVENPTAAHRWRKSTTTPSAPSRLIADNYGRWVLFNVRAQSIADRRYGRYVAAAASAAMQPSPCASVADAATATGLRFCFQV